MFKALYAFALTLICLSAMLQSPAISSPPPPPPPWVSDASKTLTNASIKDWEKVDSLFAPDVTVSENGREISKDKLELKSLWTNNKRHYFGRILGYSMGWKNSGTLLVFDEYDTADYKASPAPPGDPRSSTRSTLYVFGQDHLIHEIQIANVDAFFIVFKKLS